MVKRIGLKAVDIAAAVWRGVKAAWAKRATAVEAAGAGLLVAAAGTVGRGLAFAVAGVALVLKAAEIDRRKP